MSSIIAPTTAAPSQAQNMFIQPQQSRNPSSDASLNYATDSVNNFSYGSTPYVPLPEIEAPLESTDWQEQHNALSFQNWSSYDSYDPTLLQSIPIDYGPLSLDNIDAFASDGTMFDDNLVTNSPELAPDSTSGDSGSKSSVEDEASQPTPTSTSSARVEKRKANTLAARRYRQKRLDKLEELESALKKTQLERDALKVQVAQLQGESQVLKDIVCRDGPRGSGTEGNGGKS
ncbi:MAG: hypothetical protein M4579_005821 [Chaenotheca gracillima]|nr:MAG: hypothetical protein M4579_005821 [Chaenotheca gracillima]